MHKKEQKSMVVVGAGERGQVYASYAKHFPEQLTVLGVAEPRIAFRNKFVQEYQLDAEFVYRDWQSLSQHEKIADIAIIATPDSEHADAAIALAEKGYHLLLEKPMATTEEECKLIVKKAKQAGITISVCHVLRFTPYTQLIKESIDSGVIGKIISIQHLEPVGYWHQAHSFVRGNWAVEEDSTFMLLAKSCHDLDWIRYIMNSPCVAVSSFGGLSHFHEKEKPEGAAERCLDCSIEVECPYSAQKIYLQRMRNGDKGWPVSVLHPNPTVESIEKELRTGPYGRCVYLCDNDVVDHQVVNMLFAEGQTAAFSMTAFTALGPRRTRIFGTLGEIEGDGHQIKLYRFATNQWETRKPKSIPTMMSGHGGGDLGLMQDFIQRLQTKTKTSSSAQEILESHLIAFAAERSRREGIIVPIRSN